MRRRGKLLTTTGRHRLACRRRIIFLFSSLELGGAERQAIHLATFLKHECKSEVEIWGLSRPGQAAELCAERGISFRSVRPPLKGGIIAKLMGMARLIKELRSAAGCAAALYNGARIFFAV